MHSKPWSWWIDFILVNCVLLLSESARGVVLATLWPYVQSLNGSKLFLAILVSLFSVGRFIASILFGILSDYFSTKSVLIVSCLSCVGGNFLFIFAGNDWVTSKTLLLISRILTGFGTGMLSVARTHVSVTTPSDERTLWMSWLGIVQFIGFAVTPVIGSIDVKFSLGILQINVFTFATFVLLILEAVLIICLVIFMSKQSINQSTNQSTNQSIEQSDDVVAPVQSDMERESSAEYAALADGPLMSPPHMSRAQPINQSISPHVSRAQSINQSINQPMERYIIQPIIENEVYLNDEVLLTGPKPSNNPSVQLIRCVSEPDEHFNQSINHAINQPINQSVNPLRPVIGDRAHSLPIFLTSPRSINTLTSPNGSLTPQASVNQSFNQPSVNLSRNQSINQSDHEVIVYVEDGRSPDGRDAILSPHRFILSVNQSNNQSILIPTEETRENLALLDENNQSINQSINQSKFDRFKSIIHLCKVPLVFVFLNLSGRGVLSVAEAYGTQLFNEINQSINPSDTGPASNFFLILGCLGLLVFLVLSKVTKYVDETTLLLLSFIAMGIGFGVLVDFQDFDIDMYDFSAGMTLIWVIGTPISQTLSVSMLSRYFTNEQTSGKPIFRGVGFWMGVVTSSGSIGRIIFPLIAGSLYEPFGSSAALLFASLAAFATCLLIIFPLHAWRPYADYVTAMKRKFGCCFRSEKTKNDHSNELEVKTEWPGTLDRVTSINHLINRTMSPPSLALCQSSPLTFSLSQTRPQTSRSQSIPVIMNSMKR